MALVWMSVRLHRRRCTRWLLLQAYIMPAWVKDAPTLAFLPRAAMAVGAGLLGLGALAAVLWRTERAMLVGVRTRLQEMQEPGAEPVGTPACRRGTVQGRGKDD